MAVRSNFAALMAPGLRKAFFDRYKDYPRTFDSVFNMNNSDQQFEVVQGIAGFGLVPSKPESSGIVFDDPIQGYSKTYQHTRYGLGYRVSYEAYRDDRFKILGPRMSRMLGKSANVTREIIAAGVVNNGFGDVGPDGVSLFNFAHPLEGGGAWANRPSTPVALSQTALQNAFTTFRSTPDGRGLRLRIRPKYLIVPPALEFYARELIGSTLKPDGNSNNVNSIANSLDILVWDYLTSDTAWFLATDKEDHSLNWFDRDKIKFDDKDDWETDDAMYKVTWSSSCGYDDARGVYGSPGS